MLSILALFAALTQDPPAPPPPPEGRTSVFVRSLGAGPGIDKDGDGQVTRDEFAAPMADAFADLDKDGNGRLSTEELDTRHGPTGDNVLVVTRDEGPGAPRRFELRRPGGEGPRGDREVVIVEGRGGLDGLDRPMRFSRRDGGPEDSRIEIRRVGGGREGPDHLDKDGDGKVSEAEFTEPLREAFQRMDADRSGFIEEGERGAEGDVRVFTRRLDGRED